MKVCAKCGVGKPVFEFWVSRKGKTADGLKGECKGCAKARRRTWAAKNRDREAEWNRQKYLADPDSFKLQAKRWREENREAYLANRRRNEASRRARKNEAFIEVVDALVVLEMDDGICGICEKDVDPFDFHIDHIIPLAKGGEHAYYNSQVAHPLCNLSKGARL